MVRFVQVRIWLECNLGKTFASEFFQKIPNCMSPKDEFLLALEFSEFSEANRNFADVVSEDDVCRAFCIPPIYTKNEKHYFLNKFKYFRYLFLSKSYPES